MEMKENLLDKYYKGESKLEDEALLKAEFLSEEKDSAEKTIFGFFENQGKVPADLEESIFKKIQEKGKREKINRMQWFRFSSAAAVVLIVLSVFLNIRNNKIEQLESDFFVMEQALYQVSQSIQPDEQEEMLVLWVDNEVEIIIN